MDNLNVMAFNVVQSTFLKLMPCLHSMQTSKAGTGFISKKSKLISCSPSVERSLKDFTDKFCSVPKFERLFLME